MQRLALTAFATAWQQPSTPKPSSLSILVRYHSCFHNLKYDLTNYLLYNANESVQRNAILGIQPNGLGLQCNKKEAEIM